MHSHWRDCKAWQDEGLLMTSTSNEAVKLYDATLTQYVSWYDDKSMGGIEHCLDKMMKEDPDFVMGDVLRCGLDLMGTGRSIKLDPEFKRDIETLVQRATTSSREQKHIKAIDLFAHGKMREACVVWEDILLDHPRDMLALKYAHDAYFYLGNQCQIRDSVARVLPHWSTTTPLYSHLLGQLAFGLEETNLFDEAEKLAHKALSMNKHDAWATHTVAHVLEMTGRSKEGIAFMSGTLSDWEICGMLACHNFWHWALYHIERNEPEAALDIYDSACITRASNSRSLLDVVDICSLLMRLEAEGVNVGNRWKEAFEVCKAYKSDHITVFNDAHIIMSCLGSGHTETAQQILEEIKQYMCTTEDQATLFKEVGYDLCQAIVAYNEKRFSDAVELLLPIRYKFVNIGGSNAQRDVFHLLLIHSALKSSTERHNKIAINLLNERKAFKACSPMTDRLMARAMSIHNAA